MSQREIEDRDNTEITEYEISRSTKGFLDFLARLAFPGNSAIAKIFRGILLLYGTLHFSMIMYYSKRFGWRLVETQWSEYRKTITKASLEIFKKTIEEVLDADYDIGALNCIFMGKKDYEELYYKIVEKIDNDIDNAVNQIEDHVERSFEDDSRSITQDVLLRIKAQQLEQLKSLRSLAGSAKEIIKQKLLSKPTQRPNNKLLSLPAPNPCTDGDKRGCEESKEYFDKMFKKIQAGAQKAFTLAGKAIGGTKICKKTVMDEFTVRTIHFENIAETFTRHSDVMIKKIQRKGQHDMENANYHIVRFNSFLMIIVFVQFMRILYNSLFKKKEKKFALTDNPNNEITDNPNNKITTYSFTHKKSMKSRLNKLNKKQLETLCKKMKKQIKNTKSGMVKSLLQPLY